MAKFHFRLQRVLDYRTSAVDAQEAEVARCSLVLRQAEQALTRIEEEQRALLSTLHTRTPRTLDVDLVVVAWRYIEMLRQEEAKAQEDIEQKREALVTARERLVELKKEEQVIAKLKEKQQARSEIADRRQEVKYLDDLATTRFTIAHGEVNAK